MISIKCDLNSEKTVIFIEKQKFEFPGVVKQMEEFSNAYLILTANKEVSLCPDNNIYAIGKDGKLLWNIKDILADHLGNQKDQWYPQMRVTDEGLLVNSFSGLSFLIDVNAGKCLDKKDVR